MSIKTSQTSQSVWVETQNTVMNPRMSETWLLWLTLCSFVLLVNNTILVVSSPEEDFRLHMCECVCRCVSFCFFVSVCVYVWSVPRWWRCCCSRTSSWVFNSRSKGQSGVRALFSPRAVTLWSGGLGAPPRHPGAGSRKKAGLGGWDGSVSSVPFYLRHVKRKSSQRPLLPSIQGQLQRRQQLHCVFGDAETKQSEIYNEP